MGDAEKIDDETEATNGEEARAAEIAMDNLECGCGNVVPLRPEKTRERAEEFAAEVDRQNSEKAREKAEQYRRKLAVEWLNRLMR